MAYIYSTRFLQETISGAGTSSRFEIPAGMVAIVRQIVVAGESGLVGLSTVALRADPGVSLWWADGIVNDTSRSLEELHIVGQAGEWFEFETTQGPITVGLYGYLLTA